MKRNETLAAEIVFRNQHVTAQCARKYSRRQVMPRHSGRIVSNKKQLAMVVFIQNAPIHIAGR
eukprot:5126593-Karenia_brevis.AAC.1